MLFHFRCVVTISTTQQFKTVVLWKLSQHNSSNVLCCDKNCHNTTL